MSEADQVSDGADDAEHGSAGRDHELDQPLEHALEHGVPSPGAATDLELGIDRLVVDPMLHEPVLVVMLQGWIDAAGAANVAADELSNACGAAPIIRFDDDTYVDYRARRPVMELRNGVNSNIQWATIELRAGRSPDGRDVLLLLGPEPDMAWRRFGRAVSDLAVEFGVTQMVAFGAYPFAAPHTRDPRLSVSSPSIDVLAKVDFTRSSVDVPAGVAATLEHAMHAVKIPAIGIWAQVPHYVASMEYPAASVALLEGFSQVTGISIDLDDLRSDVADQRRRLDRMVSDNPEHESMLAQLEELFDATVVDTTSEPDIELLSGDELADEIQQFLRDQK
ncbi:MAG: proteasome assembly chaperone family protein [Ilumatobacter sp.]|uniref:proteasome assembly chaperone family protein n=1 Tax=Ilumatobacter sp. TaxID=1967498 RepID=UPI003918BF91